MWSRRERLTSSSSSSGACMSASAATQNCRAAAGITQSGISQFHLRPHKETNKHTPKQKRLLTSRITDMKNDVHTCEGKASTQHRELPLVARLLQLLPPGFVDYDGIIVIIVCAVVCRQVLHHDLVSACMHTASALLLTCSCGGATHVRIVKAELGTVRTRFTPMPR